MLESLNTLAISLLKPYTFTKTDLLPYFEYDIEKEKMEARKLKPNVDILEVNIKDKQSLQNVIDWINFKRKMR
jgi:hydrogenase nickel incorporation protein HypB